jgi:hypothetical protein
MPLSFFTELFVSSRRMRVVGLATSVLLSSAVATALAERSQHDDLLEDVKSSIQVQGSDLSLNDGAGGRDSYGYVAGECYDEALNPVTFFSDGADKAWIQVKQNGTNWTGMLSAAIQHS